MPSLAHMLGGDSQPKGGQTGEQRRSLMKAFILKAGGSIAKRGDG